MVDVVLRQMPPEYPGTCCPSYLEYLKPGHDSDKESEQGYKIKICAVSCFDMVVNRFGN